MLGVSIVLYRSSFAHLARAFASLVAQQAAPIDVRVHINAAEVGDESRVRGLAEDAGLAHVTVSPGGDNQGFAAAHNQLLAALFAAGASAVVVHNPDLFLAPDAIAELERAACALGDRALYGPVLELADPLTLQGTSRVDTLGIRWTRSGRHLDDQQAEPMPVLSTDAQRVDGVSGACLYVPRAAYDYVVGASGEFFDEDFFAYREDAELALRAGLLGVPSWLIPKARGLHVRNLRGTERGRDEAIDRLGVRNRFLLAAKYGAARPGGRAAPWLRDALVIAGTLLTERSSLPGLAEAWRLRRRMRAKGLVVRRFAASRH